MNPSRGLRVVSLVAAVWAVAFSLVHVYWLAGGSWGLPAGRSVWDNHPLLVIDIVAVPALAVVALLMLQLRRTVPPGRAVLGVCAAVAITLTLHFLPTVPQWWTLLLGSASAGQLDSDQRYTTLLYEPWFAVGAGLVTLAVVLSVRRDSGRQRSGSVRGERASTSTSSPTRRVPAEAGMRLTANHD